LSEKELTRLLRIKSQLNHKRPKFRRYESWRYTRVSSSWRRPRGIDSAMREKRKGLPKMPNIGYRTPKLVRHYHPSGKKEFYIRSINDLEILEKLDPDKFIIKIARTISSRKRLLIIEKADELGFKIANRSRIPKEETITEEEIMEEESELEEEVTLDES